MKNSYEKKISIVTISFNQVEFLSECMESVVSQMDNDVEYIVVDPGSTDGSRDVINSYKGQVISCYQKDNGPADGLNNGFKIANGQYFYFLNSDDVLLPGAISSMKKAIENNKKIDVFCFQGYMVNKSLTYIRPMRTFGFSAKKFCRGSTSVFQQGLLFSAESYLRAGGFDSQNRTCWDARLMFDLSMNNSVFLDSPQKIALFRIYDESITGSATNLIENKENKDKMFQEVFGRKSNFFDNLIYNILRFKKYFYLDYSFQTLVLFLKNKW